MMGLRKDKGNVIRANEWKETDKKKKGKKKQKDPLPIPGCVMLMQFMYGK